jgi:hypothetical protein
MFFVLDNESSLRSLPMDSKVKKKKKKKKEICFPLKATES